MNRDQQLEALAASDDPADVERAHQEALIRMGQDPGLRRVAACAYDRGRALAGRAQKFGTQSVVVGGARCLWPVDPGTTDSERAKWHVEGLERLRELAESAPEVTKAHLRRAVRARREALTAEQIAGFADRIAELGAASIPVSSGAVVAAYWPLPGEADPRPLARRLAAASRARLVLPVVEQERIRFREWLDDASLEPAGFGTMGPSEVAPELEPTVVLTPLVGFDSRGARLGQGGGFYDRRFAAGRADGGPLVVGIASSCQELPAVPTEPHDRRLDLVVTEVAVTNFSG